MARMPIFVVLFPGWKCQGLVGAAMVESEHWDGGKNLVLPVPGGVGQIFLIHLSKGLSGELFSGVILPVFSIAISVANYAHLLLILLLVVKWSW